MIFFLDIDEVLNLDWSGTWDSTSVKNLNTITKVYSAKYVITSTWRITYTLEKLQQIFKEQGVDGELIDVTPLIDQADRGLEIRRWIKENDYKGEFFIIDDKVKQIVEYFTEIHILHVKEGGITENLCVESAHKLLQQQKL